MTPDDAYSEALTTCRADYARLRTRREALLLEMPALELELAHLGRVIVTLSNLVGEAVSQDTSDVLQAVSASIRKHRKKTAKKAAAADPQKGAQE